jgi:hypothetical protein
VSIISTPSGADDKVDLRDFLYFFSSLERIWLPTMPLMAELDFLLV